MSVGPEHVRAIHAVTEPVNAIAYLCPESVAAYEALGLEGQGQGYVAGRAAPMGAIGPAVSIATFFNFSPAFHRYALPAAWSIASPADVLAARAEAVERVYERVEAPTDGLEELTGLARDVAGTLEFGGRPLAAANADVPLPATPFAAAWQALCVLREHRGDGHVALLTTAGLTPVEALVLHVAWQDVVSRRFLQLTRGWDDGAWEQAEASLRERGWLDEAGGLTEDGGDWRDELERETDRLATAPYAQLGLDGTRRLYELARPLAEALNDNGGFRRPAPLPSSFPA